MSELNFGSDSEGFARALEQMEQLADAKAELDAKDKLLREGEEASTGAIIDNTSALQRAISETRALAVATGEAAQALAAETAALRTQTTAWEAHVAVLAEAATLGSRATGVGARRTVASAPVAVPAAVAAEEAAQRRVTAAPLVAPVSTAQEARERELRAQRAAAYLSPLAGGRAEDIVVPEGGPRYRPYEQTAAGQIAAEEARRHRAALRQLGSGIDQTGLGALRQDSLVVGQTYRPRSPSAAPEQAAAGYERETTALHALTAAESEEAAEAERLAGIQNAAVVRADEMAAAQGRLTLAYHESVAAYAESSTALSRNGALTTEFIQAFARGDVTLKEFTSQMTSTIGKFGGWAIAGGLVYGAYDAIKKLGEGAKQTQEGVQQLSRFIPNVTTTQRPAAEQTFRDISTDLNVPISEVVSAMTVMARVFHNVADAGEATRAVLLAGRLDQIPQQQAEQYFTGISQSLNFTSGSQLVGVVNSLNALQNQFGARVNQTLPALARAAPAAEAGGLNPSQLEALVAVGVRAGIPGAQVGTALLRSIGTFAYRPQSEQVFREYGITAQRGQYGELVNQIVQRITNPAPGKELHGGDLQALAGALGGPLLGTRTLLPILEHANLIPQAEQVAAHPPSAQSELDKVLGGLGEEFRKIGITIENIGSKLESAGLLEPIQVLLQGISLVGQAFEVLLSPVDQVARVMTELPGPVKDVIGLAAGAAVAQRLASSNFGFTAQQFIGRLPGLGALQNNQRDVIEGTTSRYRTFQIPETQRSLERAAQRTRTARAGELSAAEANAQQQYLLGTGTGSEAEQAAADETEAAYVNAKRKAATAAAEQAQLEAQLIDEQSIVAVLTSDQVTQVQKINYIYQEQLAVNEQTLLALKERQKLVNEGAIASAIAAPAAGAEAAVKGAAAEPLAAAGAGALVASTAFRQATPPEQAAIIGESASLEQPSILQESINAGQLSLLGEGATGGLASAGGQGTLFATDEFGPKPLPLSPYSIGDRLGQSRAAGALSGAADSALGFAGSLVRNPFGLLIGSQIAGQVVGGGPGNLISQIGGAAGIGALGSKYLGAAAGRGIGAAAGFLNLGGEGLAADAGAFLANPLLGAGLGLGLSGATTPGFLGLGEGAVGGGLLGGLIGTAIAPGPGTAIGAAAGAGLGGLLHQVTAGVQGDTPGEDAQKRRIAALRNVRVQIAGGLPNVATLNSFSSVFGAELDSAFSGAGNQTDQQSAQTAVQKAVQENVQLLKATGYGTSVGSGATDLLRTALSGALQAKTLRTDPYDIGQIIDTTSAGLNTGVNTRFKAQLATSTSSDRDQKVLNNDVYALEQNYQKSAGDAIKQLTANFDALWTSLQRDPGNKGLQSQLATAKSQLGLARSAGQQINTNDILQAQQDADQVYQQVIGRIQDAASLTSAEAGGNRLKQIGTQIGQSSHSLAIAIASRSRNPTARAHDISQDYAGVLTGKEQYDRQQATELQARLSEQTSTIPTYEPVQVAQGALSNATKYYNFVKNAFLPNGSPVFDAAELNAALQAKNAAVQAVADAQYSYQTSLISAQEQLAQAQSPANAAAQGAAQSAAGQRLLAIARTPAERASAQSQILGGGTASAQAAQQTAQTRFQITEANQQGDPVAAAYTALAAAREAEASALGPDQLVQAQLQYAQATQTLHQALQQQIVAEGDLKASTTNSTLAQDAYKLAAARKALAAAIGGGYGHGTIVTDQTNVNNAILQQQNDYFSQRISTIQFQQSTLQISAQQALAEYEELSKLKHLSVSQRQQLYSAEYAIQTDQNNTSLFDLAPAGTTIRTPTIYDVRGASARERARLRSHDIGGIRAENGTVEIGGAKLTTTSGALNTHDPLVEQAIKLLHGALLGFGKNGGGDVTVIALGGGKHLGNELDRTLGSRVHSRMRSAGVRGT